MVINSEVNKMDIKIMNILAIFAHPDDLSIFCAGTLARWANEGHNVYALCVTNGEVGTLRRDLTKEQVAAIREKELRTANEIIGVKETLILGYPDAGFINGSELREKLVYYVRKYKADRVVTFDPWVSYEVHPDHLIVGRMAAEAAAFAAFPLLYSHQSKENIEPYNCSEVWFMGLLGHKPNYFIDISSTLDRKITAALKFEATLELLANLFAPKIDPSNVSEKELKKLTKHANTLYRSLAEVIGKSMNLTTAEAFYVLKTLPGHFDNFQQSISELLGNPPEKPKIY
ncbi:MAG: PIG-L family deacetylase [Candidatus Lokiarchaeota archaeon]|nr:PIG-L family deacetylase [Candidatus Lokiarchaeota archaeon]